MTTLTVSASTVRVPDEARQAIDDRTPVTVVSYSRPRFVLLHPDDFALVAPLLERAHEGRPIPVEQLLTNDDFEILREEGDSGLGLAVLESWRG